MRSITRLSLALLLVSVFCAAQQINLDTQIKGSRWPAFGTDSGAANAYAVTTIAPLGPTLRTGSRIEFFAAHANTGASTLAVNGGSTIAIKKSVSTALVSGDIPLSGAAIVLYDGTNFQLLNPQSSASVTCGQMPALTGDVTTSAGSCSTTIANNAVSAAKSAVVLTRRTCAILIGADNGSSALANSDIAPQGRQCFVSYAATVVEIEVAADAGTPQVTVAKNHAGSLSNLTSSALATAAAGGIACSNSGGTTGLDGTTSCSGTLQNTSIAAGDYLETNTATAGGTAKRMSIFITYTVN